MTEANKEIQIKRGLDGVVCDVTSVSKVMPETNSLTYRGYAVQDLAENATFEEVAYLLWHGELPTKEQLNAFTAEEKSLRELSPGLKKILSELPKQGHPMDALRTAVSYLGMTDSETQENDPARSYRRAMQLLAQLPVILATDFRARRKGQEPIAPKKDLRIAENFFHMCFGKVPEKEVVKAFEVSLILYAEHGFNASTFTARVITSTQSDLYSAVSGAIGSLKGSLHGGANEAVMHMMAEIEDPKRAEDWMLTALAEKRKIMGFGHRVYKNGDSRVPTMKKYLEKMSEVKKEKKWLEMYETLVRVMLEKKNIHPNLDCPAGPAYHLMGIDTDYFTPIFVVSRITGWAAHVFEQAKDNRLIRPLSQYVGPKQRNWVSIEKR
jgi:2-methylcitrate synthase